MTDRERLIEIIEQAQRDANDTILKSSIDNLVNEMAEAQNATHNNSSD